jgi:hypothetical protein
MAWGRRKGGASAFADQKRRINETGMGLRLDVPAIPIQHFSRSGTAAIVTR